MDDDRRESLRVLVFSASLRADSLNTRLANLATTAIQRLGVLKNAIDWVSRARPQPFNQHSGL